MIHQLQSCPTFQTIRSLSWQVQKDYYITNAHITLKHAKKNVTSLIDFMSLSVPVIYTFVVHWEIWTLLVDKLSNHMRLETNVYNIHISSNTFLSFPIFETAPGFEVYWFKENSDVTIIYIIYKKWNIWSMFSRYTCQVKEKSAPLMKNTHTDAIDHYHNCYRRWPAEYTKRRYPSHC